MASNIADLGGYDCDFVETPPNDLICLICTFVARDPVQMNCCGKVYCKACITELKETSNKCPQCRKEGNGFDDRRSDMNIKALRVKCGNLGNGCAWVGELGSLDKHQDTCDHALLACPNKCEEGKSKSVQVLRKNLATHLEVKCPNRSHQCPYCGVEGKHCDITTSHLETCTKLEVPCPNKDCNDRLPRCDILEHRKTCLLEEVDCKYSTIGCEDTPFRKDLEDHESNNQLHLDIAMETILEREDDVSEMQFQIAKLNSEITKLNSEITKLNSEIIKLNSEIIHLRTTASSHFTFKMAKFSLYKASRLQFFSPPFYTHHGGYKMCIGVYANGLGGGEGTHVSMYAYLMRGLNDDNLTWPFTGDVTVQLLNQLEDEEHYQKTITYPEDKDGKFNSRVVDGERGPDGWGHHKFIPHADLGPATNRQFLKDDCLFFRVSVNPSPKTKPWLTCTS